MQTGNNHHNLMSDINVTPFVDVMLVLLIIFMVTAPMMTQGVDVTLPEASSGPLPTQEDQIVVTIDKDNAISINKHSIAFEHLYKELDMMLRNRTNRQVYLRADRDISYGMVVRVMSEIKKTGVEKLGMITVPLSSENEQEDKKRLGRKDK